MFWNCLWVMFHTLFQKLLKIGPRSCMMSSILHIMLRRASTSRVPCASRSKRLELLIRPARLVPGADRLCGVGQGQDHHSDGAVRPGGDAQVYLGPAVPVAARLGDVQANVKAARQGHLLQRLGNLRLGLVVLGGQT